MLHAIATSTALLIAAQAGAAKAAEARDWPGPTRVRLDFSDRTLAEIVDGINAQGPAMLAIRPGSAPVRPISGHGRPAPAAAAPQPRYTIREPAPVTFWEAVERVGRATETRPVSGYASGSRPGILLAPGTAERGFARDDGAFRIVLTRTSYHSGFRFVPFSADGPSPAPPKADGSSRRPATSAQLVVMAEPRLKIDGPAELVVREAIDDRGRRLIPAAPWRKSLRNPPVRSKGYSHEEFIAIDLLSLDDPGRSIKRLAGSVSVDVSEARAGAPVATVEVDFDFADVPLP